MRKISAAILSVMCLALGVARAQLVPQVQLPPVRVPPMKAPGGLSPDVGGSLNRELRSLSEARALRADTLARDHRAELDRDPRGELVVRAEVIAIDISADALRRALATDFLLKRTQELPDLDVKVSVLQTPVGWSA